MSLSMSMTDGRATIKVEEQVLTLKSEALRLAATLTQWAEQLQEKAPRVRAKPQPQKRAPTARRKANASNAPEAEASTTA